MTTQPELQAGRYTLRPTSRPDGTHAPDEMWWQIIDGEGGQCGATWLYVRGHDSVLGAYEAELCADIYPGARSQGAATAALTALARYASTPTYGVDNPGLGLCFVWARTEPTNTAAITAAKRAGFRLAESPFEMARVPFCVGGSALVRRRKPWVILTWEGHATTSDSSYDCAATGGRDAL